METLKYMIQVWPAGLFIREALESCISQEPIPRAGIATIENILALCEMPRCLGHGVPTPYVHPILSGLDGLR